MCGLPVDAVRARGSRRRRLWELDHKHHCQLIGVCFEVAELRRLVGRLTAVPALISDFELHRCTVQACGERGRISELLHKALEKRHALVVASLRGSDEAALQQAWRDAVARGDVGATLWAVLTHAQCSTSLEDSVYGDLHMLQHQVGSLQRRELAGFQSLQREHATLLREMAGIQARATQARDQRVQELQQLRSELMQRQAEKLALQTQLQQQERRCAELVQQLPALAERERLLRRARDAEDHCQALRAHARAQEERAEHWESRCKLLQMVQGAPEASVAGAGAEEVPGKAGLNGKQVLCIGGRPHVIGFYRQLVEGQGGRFSHHDGGLEESLAALEPSIAAADAVICQAGCINHNAYWRVKDYCKRTGKTCVFLKSNGVSSFEKELQKLAD